MEKAMKKKMKTLFLDNCGPYVCYAENTLEIHDLNPQVDIRWSMSKWELFKFGLKMILASILS